MPRFPPKEKRFTLDCRVKGASKAYKKKRHGTVKTITYVGEGAKRRRRIEVEWDDLTREVVLSNAIEIIGEGEGFDDDDSDENNQVLNGSLPLEGEPYGIFANDPNILGLASGQLSNGQSHNAVLATQHLHQKYHVLGKLGELGAFDYVSSSKRTRRRCVSCGKNSSYYCMKCSNLSEGIIVPVHNADYKDGCLFDHIEKSCCI